MSSLVRRIQRTSMPSQPHQEKVAGEWKLVTNPAREIHFHGRGSKLGVHNPDAPDLLARVARENRRAA